MSKNVILVDLDNNQIGVEEKILAHKKKLLHRAFSIFLFNDKNEILLQKRAPHKYHSGNLWTNTCCSHPYEGKTLLECANERLIEEMGINTRLSEIFSFIYREDFDNGLTEYEYDHVIFGRYSKNPILNPVEAIDFKWISTENLKAEISNNPENFTAWLKVMFKDHYKYFNNYENYNL